ncbi:hypothetical protein GALMADRAFT_141421 [Galerina marginata CBS 339.88]|uniref:Uncharacterized protein n=1 Tax=Galerina marginata (strain CBS 339.88) TaxID=685588 RepID=A0A067SU10_GALM3|nr:hypothetical protein GALMADRAFT_141421 [Galerina marginata CBS 339.88]
MMMIFCSDSPHEDGITIDDKVDDSGCSPYSMLPVVRGRSDSTSTMCIVGVIADKPLDNVSRLQHSGDLFPPPPPSHFYRLNIWISPLLIQAITVHFGVKGDLAKKEQKERDKLRKLEIGPHPRLPFHAM